MASYDEIAKLLSNSLIKNLNLKESEFIIKLSNHKSKYNSDIFCTFRNVRDLPENKLDNLQAELNEKNIISNVSLIRNGIAISLNRNQFIQNFMTTLSLLPSLKSEEKGFYLKVNCEEKPSVTEGRTVCLARHLNAIINLGSTCCLEETVAVPWNGNVSDDNTKERIIAFYESEDLPSVTCGPVIDRDLGCKYDVSTAEYIRRVKKSLEFAAEQRYGFEIEDSLLHRQAENIFLLQMLSVSHQCSLNTTAEEIGISADLIFALYNYARICMLFKKFHALVESNKLNKLPDRSQINFTLLKEQEEWILITEVIFKFNHFISDLFNDTMTNLNRKKIKLPLHRVAIFLKSLSISLSIYYNRVHILSAPPHQAKTMFARLYLLKDVQEIMMICFKLCGVNPLEMM